MSKAQTAPEKETEGHTATTTAVTRRFIACTQSRGGIGKSTFYEGLITWLRYAGIPFVAIDADAQNKTLSNRYPDEVDEIAATNDDNGDTFHSMILGLTTDPELSDKPVVLVDFPGNKTDYLLNVFHNFRLVDAFEREGIRLTVPIFAADDVASRATAYASAKYFLKRVDYFLVENPACFKSKEFKKTDLYKWLVEQGTPTFRIPTVSSPTMNSWTNIERTTKKHIPLDEACTHPEAYRTVRYELANFRDSFLCQFEDLAVPRILSDASLIQNKVVRSSRTAPVPTATLSDSWL